MTKKNTLDLLIAATEADTIREDFDVTINDHKFELSILAPDTLTILRDQDQCYLDELQIQRKKGNAKKPIDEDLWQSELDAITDEKIRKATEDEKPKNYAEQMATRSAKFSTIVELLPKIIVDRSTGEYLAKTSDERDALSKAIAHPALAGTLTEKYTAIMLKIKAAREQLKNLEGNQNSD